MDRGKSGTGRGGKSKTPQYPADLFALGAKSSNEAKRTSSVHGKPSTSSHSISANDRKREAVSSSIIPAKKPKLSSIGGPIAASSASKSSTTSNDAWESKAIDIDYCDFVVKVLEAKYPDEADKVTGILCGALKALKSQKMKLDSILCLGVIYLAKVRPKFFSSDFMTSALCSLIRKEPAHSYKFRNPHVCVIAAAILYKVYESVSRWPDVFIKLLIEDSIGERSWVDIEECKGFVDNILCGINTKPSPAIEPESLLRSESSMPVDDDPPPSNSKSKNKYDFIVHSRYSSSKETVETIILESVKDQLNRRQNLESITKNFLKFLVSSCGLIEVRLLIAPRLEVWLQNPKLSRPAQELLMAVCVNCSTHTHKDIEVISALVKTRVKTKNIISFYLASLRELISAHTDNLPTVIKHIVYNELSTSRNPNNMQMLNVVFQYNHLTSASILSDIYQELLLNRDDYLRPLRSLLREIWRHLKGELNLLAICRGLMSQTEPLPRDGEYNQRAFAAITDLITLCIFLAVASYNKPDKKESVQLEDMQLTISGIQSDAIWWLQETALRIYRPNPSDFVHALHKVLLMEPTEQYYKVDMWPQDQDRALFLRLASEVPLEQGTLLRVLLIGMSKEHPLTPPDALELADQLVKRAAAVPNSENIPVLKAENLELIDLVFNLCTYHHPENIDLPPGYTPPTLAITNLYWKGWTLLLILAAHNPATYGSIAWEKYPTLRVLMEMCITNHFIFPPIPEDLQMLALEKQAILQFETHLAAASTKVAITQQTSLLLSQLMSLEPSGPPRHPPQAVLDQLQTLNSTIRLGHLLCRSRRPDFLLDIIQRQGATQSMPWLADLVQNSDGSLSHLPVQCLCEFLLSCNTGSKQQQKYQQLLLHLQGILNDPAQDPGIVCEILDYFLRRLSSTHNRAQAINGLKLLLNSSNDEDVMETDRSLDESDDLSWLLKQIPLLPHFNIIKSQIILALRAACQVENEPTLVTAYLCFLAQHISSDISEVTDLVVDMAQLIVERSTIMSAIMPLLDEPNIGFDAFITIFFSFLNKAREPRREAFTWSESQDQIIVSWPSGEDCTLHILVVHAMVILLTYGPLVTTHVNEYNYVLDAWFPIDREAVPKAFLVDTSEEALLIPDWLKLRMIRSQVPRLVEAALTDLEPPQLILFIQSFGIPVASMSKLLETLDKAVVEDRDAVGDAVMDKAYMVQLVDVQHRRGATGGKVFARVLGLQEAPRPPDVLLPSIPLHPDSKPLFIDKQKQYGENEAVAALERIFLSQEVDLEEKNRCDQLFRSLQRTLAFELSKKINSSFESKVCKTVLVYLLRKTASDRNFVKAIILKNKYSCLLFRLFTNVNSNDLVTPLVVISSAILRESGRQSSPLVGILKNFMKRNEHKEIKMIDPITTKDPIKVLSHSPVFLLEHRGRMILDAQTNKVMISNSLGTLLTQEARPKLSENNVTGLFIDWLIQVEPEIIGFTTDLQIRLLFSRNENQDLAAVEKCRPHLLTLLTHQASWSTLYRCTNILLNEASILKYDPSAVLDFLTALTCNPKLWQGRDKYTPKHRQAEDVLCLTMQQVLCVADYIVEEAMNNSDVKCAIERMNNRILLLSQCLGENELRLTTALVRHINKIANTTTGKKTNMCGQLLVQLYLRVPSLICQVMDIDYGKYLDSSLVSVSVNSVLDKISHTILTALTATPQTKDWPRRSQELELAARKMADTHPYLVLRQLKMIAASLHGRVHFEFNVFRSRGHLALFQHVLGILELLQPHLFKEEYTDSLNSLLNSYFSLFKAHGGVKEASHLLNRVVTLLQNYISNDPTRALCYIQSQYTIISELRSQHSNLSSLCIMSSGAHGSGELVLAMPPPNQSNSTLGYDVANLLKGEDALSTLQDLDSQSVRRPSILESAFGSLCRLLASRCSSVRGLAHGLLARYLRFSPHSAKDALPAYLSCLDSPHTEVITTALERLPELTVCCQELALPLLKKVFSVGLSLNINTTTCIIKTIGLLNQQSGC